MNKLSICEISTAVGISIFALLSMPTLSYAYGGWFNYSDYIGVLMIWLIVVVVIFLLMREVLCWYAKINERLAILKEIRDSLNKIDSSKNFISEIPGSAISDDIQECINLEETDWKSHQEIYESGYCPSCGTSRSTDGGRCIECNENFFDYAKAAYQKKI